MTTMVVIYSLVEREIIMTFFHLKISMDYLMLKNVGNSITDGITKIYKRKAVGDITLGLSFGMEKNLNYKLIICYKIDLKKKSYSIL